MKKIAGVALALVALSAPADAVVTSYKLFDVCAFDYQQYCKSINKKLRKDIKACLANHEKNLLPRCQDHYKEAR